MSFVFRKTTKAEDEIFENKCSITLPNTMRCNRRITRVVNMTRFLCEGHFAVEQQLAAASGEPITDLDAGGERLTGKSEPTEK